METPRELPSGTPARAAGYIRPPDKRRPLWWALGLAGAVLLVFAVLFASGRRGVASPGAVSAGHSAIGGRCAECHDVARSVALRPGSGTADLRCERCHDPGASDRLLQTSHAARGTGITAASHSSETVACATCHAEHRGRADLAHAGDDRTCVRCHAFGSLARHPEFAAVAAKAITGAGLKFTHDRHIAEVRKEGGQRCEACHQPTADLSGFEPIDFDAHCASCHTKDGAVTGETDPLDGRALLPPPAGGPAIAPGARSLVVVSRMAHRDDWVLDNLNRMRRIVDPEGDRAERLALQTRIASLSSVLQAQSFSGMAPADLERLRDALARDRDALSAAPAAAGQDAKALAEMTAAIRRIAGTLDAAAPALADPAPAPGESADAVRARFDARKAELLALLDAVTARGNPGASARAAALRARVQALAFTAPAGDAGVDQLRDRLTALDGIFRALRGLPDQQAASDAAAAEAFRDAARRQIAGGLPVDQFEARRRELLRLLDAIGRQGQPSLAARVAPLRQRVLMLRAGDASIEERRARAQRLLDRVTLEIELARGGETAAPSAAAPQRDRRIVQPLIARFTRQLARLNMVPAAASPETLTAASAASAAAALAGPCLKCHVADGVRLAPVAAAARVFRRASFTHKPHVPQADCLSCHGGVTTSKLATDLVVPGVATCQSCHAPSRARSDCAACHTYHPSAAAQLADLR